MPLEIRRNDDGTLREFWYGRYRVNGRRYCTNLKVKIEGAPPAGLALRFKGDAAFEESRREAIRRLDGIVEEARGRRDSAHLVEKLIEIKTGERPKTVELAKLPEAWGGIPRRREPNARYAAQCKATLTRFAEFVAERYPRVTEVLTVGPEMARAFLEAEGKRKVSAKTWNDTLKLLRATFKHLLPQGAANPFVGTPTKETATVFRVPFSPEELGAVMEAAKLDGFVRPLLVTAMCTAMRRGDCCLLRWSEVDLGARFVTVKTSKTGQTVDIPIFPVLQEELEAAKRTMAGAVYCFPEQAEMYLENPDGITWRVKKVLAEALGEGDAEERSVTARLKSDTTLLNSERAGGLRRASIRDFHSFRVTWVTLALTAGMPLEMVQRVTGHKTADVVLKHYFKPGRESFRAVLGGWLPQVLTGLPGGVPAEYLELHRLTGKLAEGTATAEDRERFRELAKTV